MTRSCSVWNLIIYSNACTCGGIFSRNCLKADTWTQLKTCFLSYLSEEWILLDTLELLRACILYSQIIFSQKTKKNATPSRFQNAGLPCELPALHPGPGILSRVRVWAGRAVTPSTHCPALAPIPATQAAQTGPWAPHVHDWHVLETNPASPHSLLPLRISLSVYQVLAKLHRVHQPPQILHLAQEVIICPLFQTKHFALCSLVPFLHCRNEGTRRLHTSALGSAAWHWLFQRR